MILMDGACNIHANWYVAKCNGLQNARLNWHDLCMIANCNVLIVGTIVAVSPNLLILNDNHSHLPQQLLPVIGMDCA
jgi:hypothetical protein